MYGVINCSVLKKSCSKSQYITARIHKFGFKRDFTSILLTWWLSRCSSTTKNWIKKHLILPEHEPQHWTQIFWPSALLTLINYSYLQVFVKKKLSRVSNFYIIYFIRLLQFYLAVYNDTKSYNLMVIIYVIRFLL